VSACAKRTHSSRRRSKRALHARGRRPSLGPEARARQSPLNSRGASRRRWRGRFGIAVGQTCASRRNRHRGRNERTNARLAARHRFSSEKVVRDASEKEGGHGLRPCEETRAPVGVRTSCFVAEVGRQGPGPKYARTQRSKKSGGESERGPSRRVRGGDAKALLPRLLDEGTAGVSAFTATLQRELVKDRPRLRMT